jgi:uncharacterized protein YecT (DUF1311 family)
MKSTSCMTGILLMLASSFAMADNCPNAATQGELNQCAAKQFAEQDKALNKTYGEYRKKLNDAQKKQLTEVQQIWINFRDKACAFEASGVEGGSAYPMVLTFCKADKTAVRVKELKTLNSCKEGDLSCPAF